MISYYPAGNPERSDQAGNSIRNLVLFHAVLPPRSQENERQDPGNEIALTQMEGQSRCLSESPLLPDTTRTTIKAGPCIIRSSTSSSQAAST